MSERYAAAATDQDVARADQEAAAVHAADGAIRLIRTWYLPEDETCFSLFEAPSATALRAAGEAAGVRYARITAAVETIAEPLG